MTVYSIRYWSTMGHSAEATPTDRLSPVGSPDLSGTNVLSGTSTDVRDSCKCSRYDADGRRVVERVDRAQFTDVSSSTSYPCASHMTHNQTNSLSRPDVRHSRSRRTPSTSLSSSTSSSSSHTDSVFSSKKAATATTPDLRRNSNASWSLSCCWFSRRMYMGNITPWTLSFMFYLFVIILSHQVESTHSVPAVSTSFKLHHQFYHVCLNCDARQLAIDNINLKISNISRFPLSNHE